MSSTSMKQGFTTFQKHLMTGIGYMIPVIVAPGIVMGVAQVAASMLGLDIKSAEALASVDALTRCLAGSLYFLFHRQSHRPDRRLLRRSAFRPVRRRLLRRGDHGFPGRLSHERFEKTH